MDSIILILQKCLKQDRNSQRWVYENYYAYALKIAFRYCELYDDAASVVNDSFVNVFKSLHQFSLKDTENAVELRFKGWLRKTVINKSIDKYRSSSNSLTFQNVKEEVYEIADKSNDADTLLLYKEMIAYLKNIPFMYQLVFNLYVIDGYTHSEIAAMLKISEGTSKSNLSRARQMLQKQLTIFFETNK